MALILVVDDSPFVYHVVQKGLEHAGHSVTTAANQEEACGVASRMTCIDLLIIDHALRPDCGRQVAEDLRLIHPAMKVIHTSGWPIEKVRADLGLLPGSTFLAKPFTVQLLRSTVRAVLA